MQQQRDRGWRLGGTAFAALALSAALLLSSPTAVRAGEPAPPREPSHRAELVLRALSLLGVNYKLGGNSPDTGLDCSGLVRHVFREAVGLVLPRRAEEISRAGDVIGREQLRPGDLVFFNTLRRTFSHVGIYIGNGQFVHAPSSGGSVRVESLSGSYWTQRFNGARRMLSLDAIQPESPPQGRYAGGWISDHAGALAAGGGAATGVPAHGAAAAPYASPQLPDRPGRPGPSDARPSSPYLF